MMLTTEAWVLYEGGSGSAEAELRRETFTFEDPTDDEVLVEPIYGSWEGNMAHAIDRRPIDVCRARGEPRVVLGNAGVVRVLRPGRNVTSVEPDDLCIFFGAGRMDAFGYMELAHAYDAPKTIGLLAKQTKVAAWNLIPIPSNSKFSPTQWAAFSLRYLTAWSNWRVAIGALRLQLSAEDLPCPHVWGWGGGSTLAELDLARRSGCITTMITGSSAHRREIAATGIETIDRSEFPDLQFDPARYERDPSYASAYRDSETRFLKVVRERTEGLGVAIFIDYIGTPVLRATLKALGRGGVLATAGWKHGMDSSIVRAMECLKRHTHVHTHYARHSEGPTAVEYAERNGWMPRVDYVYSWDDIPVLVREYAAGQNPSYFTVFAVNPV
jgi:NADPH:quinone reductase-like Zn-dependent oxidoreductase